MPHFPQVSRETSQSVGLPTRERMPSQEEITRRPHPTPANDAQQQRTTRLRVQTRRRRYLDLNPQYFSGANLEQADPLLYDRLVRRFQSAAEREAEGRARGAAGNLEATLVRSEAKVEAVRTPSAENPLVYERGADGVIVGLEEDAGERVAGKEEGLNRWRDVMGRRFMRGEDVDFDYRVVDGGEEFDDLDEEGRGAQEDWFEGEEQEFVGHGRPAGETGVQDF
ncbi:hypothetical protein Q7P37_011131 [Cladosporium fusiforme]